MQDLRKQIADCLRYIRKNYSTNLNREYVEEHISTVSTEYIRPSLSELILFSGETDLSSVYVVGGTISNDGGDESFVDIIKLRKQTDDEYYDSICSWILPSDYQQKQYNDYIRLKELFEGN